MKILTSKWVMLFLMIGIFVLFIPGFVVHISLNERIGAILMAIYLVPVLIWAITSLLFLTIEYIKNNFNHL